MKKLLKMFVMLFFLGLSFSAFPQVLDPGDDKCLWDAEQGDCDDTGTMFCSPEPGACD